MEQEIIELLQGRALSVAEIVQAIGTGDRCRKMAQALVRRRLSSMVEKSLIHRERWGKVWVFEAIVVPSPRQLDEQLPQTPVNSAITMMNDQEFMIRLFPPLTLGWSKELRQSWFHALNAVIDCCEKFDVQFECKVKLL